MLSSVLAPLINSLLSLLIGTLIGSELSRYLYTPKVVIRYKDVKPLNAEKGVFWSVRVENKGRTVAKKCIGTMTLANLSLSDLMAPHEAAIDEELTRYQEEKLDVEFPREQIVSQTYFRDIDSVSLCWAKLGNPDSIDINPGISQTLDVCKFHSSEIGQYLIFPSEFGWRRVRLRTTQKDLRGEISICPENEFPTSIQFKVTISDDGISNFTLARPKKSVFSRVLGSSSK